MTKTKDVEQPLVYNSSSYETKIVFDNELKNKIKLKSFWFICFIFLINWPGFCFAIESTLFTDVRKPSTIRCDIPELNKVNWTFEQIKTISQPTNIEHNDCQYYIFNYTLLSAMKYENALAYVESHKNFTNLTFCKTFLINTKGSITMEKEFHVGCNNINSQLILVTHRFGSLFSGLFLCWFGDILGRKRIIKWGADIFMFGGIVTALANSIEALVFGRMLIFCAYICMKIGIEAIIMEIFDPFFRQIVFISSYFGTGFGHLLCPLLTDIDFHWRHVQWLITLPLFFLPVVTWFIPESPRLFLMKKRKSKAWLLLRNMKNPAEHNESLYMLRNDKFKQTDDIKNFFKKLKKFSCNKHSAIFIVLVFIAGCNYHRTIGWKTSKIKDSVLGMYQILTATMIIISLLLSLVMLICFCRKISLMISFMLSTFTLFISSQFKFGSIGVTVINLLVQLFTQQVKVFCFLCVSESTPTLLRCTLTGLAQGGVFAVSSIIVGITYYNISEKILYGTLGGLTFGGLFIAMLIDESYDENFSLYIE